MPKQQLQKIDSVTLSVVNNAFVNVCCQMGTAMMRIGHLSILISG